MSDIFKEIDQLQEEISSQRPFSPSLLKQIKEYYRIGLTYSSNALEGNTLTESETKVVLEEGLTIGGKPLRDHLEAQGLSKAYDFMFELVDNKTVSEENIQHLHQLFFQGIDKEHAGVYRDTKAIITGSKYPLPGPDKVPGQMAEMIAGWVAKRADMHPVEFAAVAHKEFVFIHPFIDGNGRVARLLMNLILLQSGYSIAIIPPVMRAKYIEALELAHEDGGSFTSLIANMVMETQRDFLRLLA